MLNQLILGVGLFFLGMQLVGEYMRRLSGPSVRALIHKYTRLPLADAIMGIGLGALTQSATAVTFTLVSMVRSGLITAPDALPIILGSNIGLTALAFLIVFDIHPLVTWWVGCASIAMALARRSTTRAIAGIFLGIGLLLFALQEMGQGASFLKSSTWFQDFLHLAQHTPLLAFSIGIIAAALLQSNTGATLLIITIASAGGMELETALLLIYGTNLGAIVLRAYLAINLRGENLRLVRFEDAFCAFSGALMLALYFFEKSGIPLVASLVTSLSPSTHWQLAIGFLLSNLFPAILLYPIRNAIFKALAPITPESAEEIKSRPMYISDAALHDPNTAIDLQAKELCRLFRMITIIPRQVTTEEEDQPDPAFISVGEAIEHFGTQLAGSRELSETDAELLHQLRAGLSLTRHLEEAVREYCQNLAQDPKDALPFEHALSSKLEDVLTEAGNAMDSLEIQKINSLRDHTRRSNPALIAIRNNVTNSQIQRSPSDGARTVELLDHFELSIWLLHRFVKVMEDLKEQFNKR